MISILDFMPETREALNELIDKRDKLKRKLSQFEKKVKKRDWMLLYERNKLYHFYNGIVSNSHFIVFIDIILENWEKMTQQIIDMIRDNMRVIVKSDLYTQEEKNGYFQCSRTIISKITEIMAQNERKVK